MRAAIVVLALLALPGCCSDRGAYRVRDDRRADRATGLSGAASRVITLVMRQRE